MNMIDYAKREMNIYQGTFGNYYEFYEDINDFRTVFLANIKVEIDDYEDLTDLENYLYEQSEKIRVFNEKYGDNENAFILKEETETDSHDFLVVSENTTREQLQQFFDSTTY